MSDFFDATLQFPTVIFTVLVVVSFGVWIISTVLGFGLDTLDIDFDGDVDADTPGLGGFLEFFGLAAAPLVFTLSLSSLFGWFISLALMEVIGSRTTWAMVSLGIIVFAVALVAGMFIAGFVAKPFAPLFVTTEAQKRADFIGRMCVVRTERVTETFGQAETTDSEGAALLVQVRAAEPNDFRHGTQAIIFALDDDAEVYRITVETDLS